MFPLGRIDPRLEAPRAHIIGLNVKDFPYLFLCVCEPALVQKHLSQSDSSGDVGAVQSERFLVMILSLINATISCGDASEKEMDLRVRTVDRLILRESRLRLTVFAGEE